MNKWKKEEPVTDIQTDTRQEYTDLRVGMKKFSAKNINGRTYGAWEQYMESIKVLRFAENGQVEVSDFFRYTKYNRMLEKLERLDAEEQKKFFVAYPEEKVAWGEKRDAWFKEVYAMLRLITNRAHGG